MFSVHLTDVLDVFFLFHTLDFYEIKFVQNLFLDETVEGN